MSDALRELIASFVVEVDKAGELAKGNAAIDSLKERLAELQESFKKVKAPADQAGRAISDVFTQAARTAARNLSAIGAASAFGGRADNTGFGAAGAAAAARAEAAMPQFGPTRETLNAGRAQMAAAEQAAAAYAKTLRGRLAGAVKAVKDGFAGPSGRPTEGGPGLLDQLLTFRNAVLALGAGRAVGAVKHLVDNIGSIGEGAAKLGVTNAQFQRLGVLAEQNDTSVEALGGAFRNLANAAAQPTKETSKAFEKLGVSTKDANGQLKSSNDLFFDVSRGLAGVANETERSALAQDLLGRGAQDLKAVFSSGTEAVDRQRIALEKLGVLSDETIAQADEASDMWAGFGLAILAAAEPLLNLLLPALLDLTKALATGIGWLGKWLKQTDLVSVAITALGGYMALKFIPALRMMITLGGGAEKVFLGMAGSAAKAALSFARAALGLLIIEDFIVFLRGGDSETGRLIEALFGKEGVEVTLKAIADLKHALVDLWNWVTGAGSDGSVARIWQEFGNGITVMINDLLHAVGIGKGGTNGPFKLMEETTTFNAGAGSHLNFPGAYGPPTADGSTGSNPGRSVTIGDTNVTITGYSAADSKLIAADLDSTLERNREAIVAGVP